MTGPGPGKIEISCNKLVVRVSENSRIIANPTVYIHIRGYSYARVTHIDIEYPGLEKIVGLRVREIVPALVERTGYYIIVRSYRKRLTLILYSRELAELFPNRYRGGGVLGGKMDGVFIGVKKEIIERLESLGTKLGWPPRSRQ